MPSPAAPASPGDQLADLVTDLLQAPVPVTFLDAIAVVRRVERLGDLETRHVAGLVRLHDAGHLTDGGRDILRELLEKTLHKLEAEYALARGPIGPQHSGQRARLAVGEHLEVRCERHPTSDYRWVVGEVEGPLRCDERLAISSEERAQCFDVAALRAGYARLTLIEQPEPLARSTPKRPLGKLELYVVVEARRARRSTNGS